MVNDNNNILDKIEENGKLSKEEQAVASLTGDFIFGIYNVPYKMDTIRKRDCLKY